MTKKPSRAKTPDEGTVSALDELTFMRECASRMNAFIATYPREAQRVLRAFISYEHELVEVHKAIGHVPTESPPGVTFGGLFAAILQTHHGTGYYLRPVVEDGRIARLEVAPQGAAESVEHKD